MRLHHLALVLPFGLAACGSDVPANDATFATASPAQIYRAYQAAVLDESSMISLGNTSFSADCPHLSISGTVRTYTGGCSDGALRVDGSWTGEDGDRGMVASYQGVRLSIGSEAIAIDGTASEDGNPTQLVDESATVTRDGLTATAEVHLSCSLADLLCAPRTDRPSWITIDGLGSASIDGSWHDFGGEGTVILHGADDLTIAPVVGDARGCVTFAVGDRTGTACDTSSLSLP